MSSSHISYPQTQGYPLHEPDNLGLHPVEIIAMLRRRWIWIAIPAVLGLAAAATLLLMRHPLYQSSATLLIDSPQIPTSLVASPLTDIADERIAKIRQQIVSRDSLSGLIRENGLYPELKDKLDFPSLLGLMRQNIGVNLVGANEDQNGGRTIAFTLSFQYPSAHKAQAITRQLTQLFLIEDKRFRTEQASGTAAFLAQRSNELRRQLRALEQRRRKVEAQYAGALPDNMATSAQSLSTLRAEIARTDAETQGLVQQSSLLAAHQQELEQAPRPGEEGLHAAEDRLAQLSATHSDRYPDVISAKAEVERLRAMVRNQPSPSTNLIRAEIAANRERVALLASRRADLVVQMSNLDHLTALAPQAAYELNMIEREYENIKRQYDSLREKQLDAQVAANLQSEDKGERFTVVDQPSLPLDPLGPKPLVVLFMGLVSGTALGICIVVAHELLRGTIHGEETLRATVPVPTFGRIPSTDRPSPFTRWLPEQRRLAAPPQLGAT